MGSDWNMCHSLINWNVLEESGTDVAKCCRKVGSGRNVAGAIRSLVNARGLRIQYVRVLHETLLVPLVLLCGSKTLIRKEKEIFKIRTVQMGSLRGLLGIRRTDRVPNENEKIEESSLR